MSVAPGHSEDLDSADAIEEALDQCAATLGGHTPQAGLLYAGIDHDFQDLLDGVEARYPGPRSNVLARALPMASPMPH